MFPLKSGRWELGIPFRQVHDDGAASFDSAAMVQRLIGGRLHLLEGCPLILALLGRGEEEVRVGQLASDPRDERQARLQAPRDRVDACPGGLVTAMV